MANVSRTQVFVNGDLDGNSSDADNISEGSNYTGDLHLSLMVPAWSHIAVVTVSVMMLMIGVLVNSGMIGVLTRKNPKGSTDIYLAWLATGDIVTLVSTCLFSLTSFVPALSRLMKSDWLCRVFMYVQHWGFLVSTVLVFCIGVDRYIKVMRPLYTGLYKAAKRGCLSAYIITGLVAAVFIFTSHENEMGICKLNPDYKMLAVVAYGTMTLGSMVSSFILLGIYVKIAVFLKRRERQKTQARGPAIEYSQEHVPTPRISIRTIFSGNLDGSTGTTRREKTAEERRMQQITRTTMGMMLITAVFFLSTVMPTFALTLYNSGLIKEKTDTANLFIFFAVRLPLVGNVSNPILLLLTSSEFRGLFVKLFKSTCNRC